MRPIQTRFGLRAPNLEMALSALSALWGETIVPNGGDAANWLGLTTQNTVRSVYPTSGPNRLLHFGAQPRRVHIFKLPGCVPAFGWSALRALRIPPDRVTLISSRVRAHMILDEALGSHADLIEHQSADAVRDPGRRTHNRHACPSGDI